MSYLKHKPGSIEELMANEATKLNDNAYQDMFKKELDKAGKGIGSMSPKEKKDFFNKIDTKYKAKNEEVQESASQVQVKRDGKGNFNLMLRGKEIGYYHKSGSKYMVYYDKDGDDYDQSDEVSSEMQAKKLAYDNMNEVKVDELTKAQEKLPPALQKAIKDKETKKEDLDNKDQSIVKDVVGALKKATKAHAGQAKDLEKAMKTEADDKADEINDKKTKDSMTKGEKKPQKLHADSGSKLTKVETEPSVDYKN